MNDLLKSLEVHLASIGKTSDVQFNRVRYSKQHNRLLAIEMVRALLSPELANFFDCERAKETLQDLLWNRTVEIVQAGNNVYIYIFLEKKNEYVIEANSFSYAYA